MLLPWIRVPLEFGEVNSEISNDRNNVCTRYIKGWISAATATRRKSEPGHLWSRVKSKFSPCMA